jgi:adenylyltransferase/sulfurtransferase
LAAAGVGRIGIVDADVVELSNLQRQLIHGNSDVGRPKAESAADRIREINPHVQVEIHRTRLTTDNAVALISQYDVVVDGSDNFATRYLTIDLCFWQKKANIYASVQRFEGQATVLAPHLGGPCYRCLVPEPPAPGTVPSCAESGVLGVLPGLLGLIQATEAIKCLTNLGEPLVGRMLHVDALRMKFREFRFHRDPACRVCGDHPEITAPIDYEIFCAGAVCATRALAAEISPADFFQLLHSGKLANCSVVDVREPWERDIASIPNCLAIPLGQLPARQGEIPTHQPIYLLCKSGGRSARALDILKAAGFSRLCNVQGGINALSELDREIPLY